MRIALRLDSVALFGRFSRGETASRRVRGSASVKCYRIIKTETRRRKPPEGQFCYSTIWFGRLRGTASADIIARHGFCRYSRTDRFL